MYCLYPSHEPPKNGLRGPLLMKVNDGGVIAAFATHDLAKRFAAACGISDSHQVVSVDLLGTKVAPYPGSWAKTDKLIIFDSDGTLDQYFTNKDAFSYEKHLGKLSPTIRGWWRRLLLGGKEGAV